MDKIRIVFNRADDSGFVKAHIYVNDELRRKKTCPNDDELYYFYDPVREKTMDKLLIIKDTVETIFNTKLNTLNVLRRHKDHTWCMIECVNY